MTKMINNEIKKMKVSKKIICLFTILCVSLCAFSQKNAYKGKREQTALKMAYELLKVYYPSGELCVSDSIWDHDWWLHMGEVDEENKKYFESYRLEKGRYDKPVYSKHISKLFENEDFDSGQHKYVADFSAPYRNFIQCVINPINRMVGILGTPTIYVFLFKYDEKGEIVSLSRSLLHMD